MASQPKSKYSTGKKKFEFGRTFFGIPFCVMNPFFAIHLWSHLLTFLLTFINLCCLKSLFFTVLCFYLQFASCKTVYICRFGNIGWGRRLTTATIYINRCIKTHSMFLLLLLLSIAAFFFLRSSIVVVVVVVYPSRRRVRGL